MLLHAVFARCTAGRIEPADGLIGVDCQQIFAKMNVGRAVRVPLHWVKWKQVGKRIIQIRISRLGLMRNGAVCKLQIARS
jgi:hypothetical protein